MGAVGRGCGKRLWKGLWEGLWKGLWQGAVEGGAVEGGLWEELVSSRAATRLVLREDRWEIMGDHGRAWLIMGRDHGRSLPRSS